jgi:hypothetical protein
MTSPVRAIAALALAMASFSCGSASTGPTVPVAARDVPGPRPDPGPPDFAPFADSDRLQEPERYGSARLDRPPASARAGVSPEHARSVFEAEQVFPGSGKDAPHSVRLASYSDDVFGARLRDDGEPVPTFLGRLVWAFVYRDVAPRSLHGPAVTSDEGRTSRPAGARCSFVVLLDAHTGEYIMGAQNCA